VKEEIKILGGRNLPPYWERFDRLQQTAHKLGALRGMRRGIYRFKSFEEFDAWKWEQALNRPDRPERPT
jgi:hypothetical protein